MASVETDRGVKEQLRLYDTKGLHDGHELPKHYYSVADGFVLVYSVDSLESFKKVDVLKKEIDKSRDKKEVCVRTTAYLQSSSLLCRESPLLRPQKVHPTFAPHALLIHFSDNATPVMLYLINKTCEEKHYGHTQGCKLLLHVGEHSAQKA